MCAQFMLGRTNAATIIVTHRPISEHLRESAATAAFEKVPAGHLRLTNTARHTIIATTHSSISAQQVYTLDFDLAMDDSMCLRGDH